jgi:hypothetical protein
MPINYMVVSQGSDLAVVNATACGMIGDYAPCGAISLEEIITHINRWAGGQATLSQIVNPINSWAQG